VEYEKCKVVIEGEEVVVVKMRMKFRWLRAVEQRVRLEPAEFNIPPSFTFFWT